MRKPGVPGDASIDIQWYIAQARKAEAAKFDFVFIVDSPYITPDSAPHFLNRLEPLTLLSAVAVSTQRIGLAGTLTASYNEPFNVARAFASLDLISGGRAGWNLVTTGLEGAAGNYGRDEHFPHDVRYRRAREHPGVCAAESEARLLSRRLLAVVRGLWDSYEDDAFPRDKPSGVFLDKSRLHALNHRGEFFNVAGPLNISRSRQGQPVIFQAGGSEDGRNLAATGADAIFTGHENFEEAQAFYRDVKQRARAAGRIGGEPPILPGISPIVAASDEEAQQVQLQRNGTVDLAKALVQLGRPFNYYDFSQHDPDAPFPDLGNRGANGYRSHAERIKQIAAERQFTLREAALFFALRRSPFVGSAKTVADALEHWFRNEAADGFILGAFGDPDDGQRFIDEVLPLLRERGLFRQDYSADTLRGHLGLPFPENRYTAARRQVQGELQVERQAVPA